MLFSKLLVNEVAELSELTPIEAVFLDPFTALVMSGPPRLLLLLPPPGSEGPSESLSLQKKVTD